MDLYKEYFLNALKFYISLKKNSFYNKKTKIRIKVLYIFLINIF